MSRFNQESETKQLLRAEIRRSPAILREYRRRHSWDWLWHLAIAVFAPLVVVAIFVMGPLMLTGPLQIGLLPRFMEVKNEYLGPSTTSGDILLGGEAMVLAAVVCLVLSNGWSCLCLQKDLLAATFWPVSDRDVFRRSLESWLAGLLYLGYILVPLTINIAQSANHSIWQWAMLLISIPLNIWHLMALSIVWCSAIRSSARPNPVWLIPATFCYALAFSSGTAFLYGRSWQGGLCEFMLMIPTGWVNAAIRHLFLEQHPLAIGYVVALAATWIYAANWLRKGFRIREIYLTTVGQVTPVFEWGLNTPPESLYSLRESAAPVSTASAVAQPGDTGQPLTPAKIQEKLRLLLGNSWEGCGFLERFVSGRMTRRQTTLLEYVFRGHPRWTLAALISTGVTFAGVATVAAGYFLAVWLGHRPDHQVAAPIGFLMWLLMTLLVETMVNQRTLDAGRISTYAGLHPVYPVGLQELMDMQRRMVLGRLLVWLAQLLAIASLDWLFAPKWVGLSYLWTSEFALLFALFIDTFGWLVFTTSVPSSFSWRRAGALAGLTALACLWLAAAALVFIPLTFFAIPAFVIVVLCSLGIRTYAGWVYRTAIDYECRETILVRRK